MSQSRRGEKGASKSGIPVSDPLAKALAFESSITQGQLAWRMQSPSLAGLSPWPTGKKVMKRQWSSWFSQDSLHEVNDCSCVSESAGSPMFGAVKRFYHGLSWRTRLLELSLSLSLSLFLSLSLSLSLFFINASPKRGQRV